MYQHSVAQIAIMSAVPSKAGHFRKFCSRVLEINFGRDSRVSKIASTDKIQHTLHDFQLPAYQCEPEITASSYQQDVTLMLNGIKMRRQPGGKFVSDVNTAHG